MRCVSLINFARRIKSVAIFSIAFSKAFLGRLYSYGTVKKRYWKLYYKGFVRLTKKRLVFVFVSKFRACRRAHNLSAFGTRMDLINPKTFVRLFSVCQGWVGRCVPYIRIKCVHINISKMVRREVLIVLLYTIFL